MVYNSLPRFGERMPIGQERGYCDYFCPQAHQDALLHISCGEVALVSTDERLVEILSEIVVRTSETAVEYSSESRFWPTAIRRCVLRSEVKDVAKESPFITYRSYENHE